MTLQKQKKESLTVFSLILFLFFAQFFAINSQAATVPSINSPAAIVIDGTTGKALYSKNADQLNIPASMTKVMTTYITFEEILAGNLTLDTQIMVTETHARLAIDAANFPGTAITLKAGNYETVDTLIRLIFQKSASVPCLMLAEHISGTEAAFVERMNATAKRLSIEASYKNSHGAYVHYITPRGQARLAQVITEQFPLIYEYSLSRSFTHRGITYTTINQMVNPNSKHYYPDSTGLKIGFTNAAKACHTSTAERNGEEVIVVSFNAPSMDHAYSDHKKLLDYGFAVLAEGGSHFHDAIAEETYEAFRQADINMQSTQGWVRPYNEITIGEFSVTLISALEKLGMIEKKDAPTTLKVKDIGDFADNDILLRGIAYGILPLNSDNTYNPTALLPQEMVVTLFDNARAVLPLQSFVLPLYNNFPVRQGATITRHDATHLILGFLHEYGHFTHVGTVAQPIAQEIDPSRVIYDSWAEQYVTLSDKADLLVHSLGVDYTTAINRVQIAELLVNMIEKTLNYAIPVSTTASFNDTDNQSVLKAVEAGIVSGRDTNYFGATSSATRQEIAVMIYQTIVYLEQTQRVYRISKDSTLTGFSDTDSVDSWARDALGILSNNGIMTGSEGRLNPHSQTTIQECLVLNYNVFVS